MTTSQTCRNRSDSDERPPATLSYGDEFGPYVITGFAGCGATSYVYRARRRDRFEPVAIKVLHPHLVADSSRRMTFYREARIMMQMDHPNVVRFEEIIEDGDTLAFVMEYVDGVTLTQWRNSQSGGIDEVGLACVFVDILRGVTAAHRRGVVHRDLKPGNILIGSHQGRSVAKIIDFGVARFVDEPLMDRDKSKITGTAAYISPEEVDDPDAVCPASDIYSIGVMLYEAACGRRPFDDMDIHQLMAAHAADEPRRPAAFNPELSSSLEEVILQTLDKSPEGRFSSAPEMIGALESALHRAQTTCEPAPEPQQGVDEAKTTQWSRSKSARGEQKSDSTSSLGAFFRRCVQAASMLVPSTGAEEGGDKGHYLNRVPDSGMPFR